MNDVRELVARIQREAGLTDPEQIAMLARTATRAIELTARAAAGENVEEDIATVRATALNLSERAQFALTSNVLAWVTTLATNVLTRLLIRA